MGWCLHRGRNKRPSFVFTALARVGDGHGGLGPPVVHFFFLFVCMKHVNEYRITERYGCYTISVLREEVKYSLVLITPTRLQALSPITVSIAHEDRNVFGLRIIPLCLAPTYLSDARLSYRLSEAIYLPAWFGLCFVRVCFIVDFPFDSWRPRLCVGAAVRCVP